jgi:hypothetical protein
VVPPTRRDRGYPGRMELLERESHRAAMREYAEEARTGSGRFVLVSGEAGVGKTSLLEQVERDLTGFRWAWGACDPLSTPRPLGPLLDLAPRLDARLEELCRRSAARDRIFDAVLAGLARPAPFAVLRCAASSPRTSRSGWFGASASSRYVTTTRAGRSRSRRPTNWRRSSVASSAQCTSSTTTTHGESTYRCSPSTGWRRSPQEVGSRLPSSTG